MGASGTSALSSSVWNTDSGTTQPNGTPKYNGEIVAENVNKQMCAGMDSSPWGTLWIYSGAYDQAAAPASGTTTAKYGALLGTAAASGAGSLTINVPASGIYSITTPASAYVGNLGTDSAGGTIGDNSVAGPTAGGNAELVIITGAPATGTSLTLSTSTPLRKNHAAGEPVTVKGYWSHDAADGMLTKSRSFYDPGMNNLMPRFGFAWLLNRRIQYNNNPCYDARLQPGAATGGAYAPYNRPGTAAVQPSYTPAYVTACESCLNGPTALGGNGNCKAPGDRQDGYVAPDGVARLFVHHSSDNTPIMNTGVYRTYNKLGDTDYPPTFPATGSGGWTATSSLGYGYNRSRFPKHWEPWETPSALAADYGRTGRGPTEGGTGWNYNSATATGSPLLGDSGNYPLVLTTWRICWHFQGGPMSRNVPWLAELDPDAVIEINSADAYAAGIATGDNVTIHTIRGSSGTYKARVGVGTSTDQNTMKGVVGIPWHWGQSKKAGTKYSALVEGPSANEVCIDASDGNTWIPESKACLCRLTTS